MTSHASAERPFPPGDYPVIVIGSGPGGLQLSYALRHHGVPHAVLSADPAAGGMFRKWPFFQRLLSWTKPYAPAERTAREYQRYDWNSLVTVEPELRSMQTAFMDGTSYFPSRPEMQANMEAFAERAGIAVRYDCRWTATAKEEGPDGTTFVLQTTDGEYRTRLLVLAVGVAEPWSPTPPGIELAHHYGDTREASWYAGKRVFIIGKQNSGFELASGLAAWASTITVCSPSPAKTSIEKRSLAGVRARYVQPFEDSFLGLGVKILDASIAQLVRTETGIRVDLKRTETGDEMSVEADVVIAATGFTCPLLDLPDLGVATFGQAKLPAVTPMWESATVPGIYFAGTISQASPGLRKHGIPAYSGAVHGHRYNSLILARHIAEVHFGVVTERPAVAEAEIVPFLLREATNAPELWHQKAYLARVITIGEGGFRDEGILPLVHALDGMDADVIAMTVETDGTGSIYPVVYVKHDGRLAEVALPAHPLLDFATPAHEDALRAALADVLHEASHA
ncbi:MAG TPA: NAD(P)-binding domain-containing protein [Candidatus Limnocylindrales bacterium]|nr:NAD(P)-binding domain-containing protein [Candidatus Limnocylindrales bacterium]